MKIVTLMLALMASIVMTSTADAKSKRAAYIYGNVYASTLNSAYFWEQQNRWNGGNGE